MKSFYVASLACLVFTTLQPAEFQAILVPGQNGCGGYSFKNNSIIIGDYINAGTPNENIDFGQQHCMDHLSDTATSCVNKKLLLYGVSQGTATILNYVAFQDIKEQEKRVDCIVLESVLGSGQSAIMHTVGKAAYLPLARFWMPPLAKLLMFRAWKLHGLTPIESAQHISTKIPVVIMHNQEDFQLDVNDARKVYCAMRDAGHEDVYLMEVAGNDIRHLDVLNADPEKRKKIAALQQIYKDHKLPHKAALLNNDVDVSDYQPSSKVVRRVIKMSQCRKLWTQRVVDVLTVGVVAFYLGKKYLGS